MGRRLLLTAVVLAGAITSVPAQAAAPVHYVALGDSYSAASGVWPPDPQAPPLCLRSTSNYPHVIAAGTGAELTDVTCGAAQTKDFAGSQYPGVAPQLDAVTPDADLVTLTIGGNDNNTFIGAILACGTLGLASGGQGSPCQDTYGSHFEDQIDESTLPALREALQAIRHKAPDAEVAILGYPWILPESGGCFEKMPVAGGDVAYLRSLQAHLNQAVATAADDTGATYVDLSDVSEGHDACQPQSTRWVEPVLFGTQVVPVHPNALGESGMAIETMRVLGLDR